METSEETELCFPLLGNTSCVKSKHTDFNAMLIYILVYIVSLLTTFLNLLVIISVSHFKQLHTPTNLLILSLAVSDSLLGLLLLFQIIHIDGCWFLGDLVCALYHYVAYIASASSIGVMVLICVDRYVAICDPLQYSTKVTQRRVKICLCLCWICSVIFHSLILMDILEQPGRYKSCLGECTFVFNHISKVLNATFSFIAPITVVVVLYTRVFVVAVSQARALRSHIAVVTLQGSVKVSAKKSEIKAARTLGIVVLTFIICFCPYHIISLTGHNNLLSGSSGTYIVCFYNFNACLNPVIYALFYPWFRKSVKLIVTLKILHPGTCDTNIL
uniref:G-protein coupled receptors family 1 profile domain-containing protein n=1 Tax=Monopterus albus TaxID=43700 RepID=A0A3Q3QEG4_MONAL